MTIDQVYEIMDSRAAELYDSAENLRIEASDMLCKAKQRNLSEEKIQYYNTMLETSKLLNEKADEIKFLFERIKNSV